MSCLAEQAKILRAEAEENNLGIKARNASWRRWSECSLCEQKYHGVVACALGWACWKTHLGRPETDQARLGAMTALGNGLTTVGRHEEALPVKEAQLATLRRLGANEQNILLVQTNLSNTYAIIGKSEQAVEMDRDVYSGRVKLNGEEDETTLRAANNYAWGLCKVRHCEEAKALMRKVIPVTRRILGADNHLTLSMRWVYAKALCDDTGATLGDLREAVTTLEDTARTARRVLGGAHPTTTAIEDNLHMARATLRASETGNA